MDTRDLSIFKEKETLARFLCPSCRYLLRDPVQPSCGHRLCKPCADTIIDNECPPCCPLEDCQEEFTTEDGVHYFPDRFVRREIQALKVRCRFFVQGCEWEGIYAELEIHCDGCSYALKSLQLCPLQAIGCSCARSMDSNELTEHLQENESNHLIIIANNLQSLSKCITGAQASSKVTMVVEADGTADHGYETMNAPHGRVRMPISYDTVESDGGISVRNAQGMPYSEKPHYLESSASRAQVNEIVVERLKVLEDSLMSLIKAKDDEIASLNTQVTKVEKQIRSKNAELEDRDFRLSLIENSNHDGTMIWKIPQFSQRKADAENGKYTSIFSLPFYTGRYGYKMCLRLYIMGDGIGKGTHLSLFFVVMRGEFDNILQWPFTHKVTFKLINQAGGRDIVDTFQPDPMSSSFRKPKSDMNIASGCPRFVSHTELERGGFVVDDTIFIKSVIDVSTVRHP